VAPTPEGTFEEEAYERLAEIGRWMAVNGEAIYATRSREPFGEGEDVRFTRAKDGSAVYAFLLRPPEEEVTLRSVRGGAVAGVRLLGYGPVEWEPTDAGLRVRFPSAARENGAPAWALRIDEPNTERGGAGW